MSGLKNVDINFIYGLDIRKEKETQGKRLIHANKTSQDLLRTKETLIPVEGVSGEERK